MQNVNVSLSDNQCTTSTDVYQVNLFFLIHQLTVQEKPLCLRFMRQQKCYCFLGVGGGLFFLDGLERWRICQRKEKNWNLLTNDDYNTAYFFHWEYRLQFWKKNSSTKDYNSSELCQQTSVLHSLTAARLSASHAMARAVVLYIQYTAQLNGIGSLGHRVSDFGPVFLTLYSTTLCCHCIRTTV